MSFNVYFDFETTTGDFVFSDQKIFVVSYCQIYSFHPGLNLDNFVIFRNFQQSPEEIYDLNHFRQKHIPYFICYIFSFCTFRQQTINDCIKKQISVVISIERSKGFFKLFNTLLKSRKFIKNSLLSVLYCIKSLVSKKCSMSLSS